MGFFEYGCPHCGNKLRVAFSAEEKICACPCCGEQIVPVSETYEERMRREQDRAKQKNPIKHKHEVAENKVKVERIENVVEPFAANLLYWLVAFNIVGGIVAVIALAASGGDSICLLVAIVCGIDAVFLLAIRELVLLFYKQVQISYNMMLLLTDLSKKLKE